MNRPRTIRIFVVVGLIGAALIFAFRANRVQAPSAATGAAGFTVYPYLQNAGPTAMTIEYAAAAAGEGIVKFGPAGGALDQSVPAKLLDKAGSGNSAFFLYRARLTGLKPGSAYQYRVAHTPAGQPADESRAARFQTWPEKTDRATFVAYGDSRSNPDRHRVLTGFIAKRQADFILHTGDAVGDGEDQEWPPMFFDPLRDVLDHMPLFFTRGNHDGSAEQVARWFDFPGGKSWYSFDCGPVHVAMIDCYEDTPPNREWLDQDLAASKAVWKFVTYHEPTLYFGYHKSDFGLNTVLPIMEKHQVDFVVAGHAHLYGRFLPLRPRSGPAEHVMTFICTGGGGARLHPAANDALLAKADSVHHYCLFTIEGPKLTLEVFNHNNHHIDRLTVTKTDGRYDEAYLKLARPLAEVLKEQEQLPPAPPEEENEK